MKVIYVIIAFLLFFSCINHTGTSKNYNFKDYNFNDSITTSKFKLCFQKNQKYKLVYKFNDLGCFKCIFEDLETLKSYPNLIDRSNVLFFLNYKNNIANKSKYFHLLKGFNFINIPNSTKSKNYIAVINNKGIIVNFCYYKQRDANTFKKYLKFVNKKYFRSSY